MVQRYVYRIDFDKEIFEGYLPFASGFLPSLTVFESSIKEKSEANS